MAAVLETVTFLHQKKTNLITVCQEDILRLEVKVQNSVDAFGKMWRRKRQKREATLFTRQRCLFSFVCFKKIKEKQILQEKLSFLFL